MRSKIRGFQGVYHNLARRSRKTIDLALIQSRGGARRVFVGPGLLSKSFRRGRGEEAKDETEGYKYDLLKPIIRNAAVNGSEVMRVLRGGSEQDIASLTT